MSAPAARRIGRPNRLRKRRYWAGFERHRLHRSRTYGLSERSRSSPLRNDDVSPAPFLLSTRHLGAVLTPWLYISGRWTAHAYRGGRLTLRYASRNLGHIRAPLSKGRGLPLFTTRLSAGVRECIGQGNSWLGDRLSPVLTRSRRGSPALLWCILPNRITGLVVDRWSFIVRPAVDLPNPRRIIRTVALRTPWSALRRHEGASICLGRSRDLSTLLVIGALAIGGHGILRCPVCWLHGRDRSHL